MPAVIAHRGASAAHPENTLEAFRAAAQLAADAVELDVRRTVEGTLVVHHDAQLGDGRIIRQLRTDELPPHVPSLADALDACGGLRVLIEIKNLPSDPDFDPAEEVADGVVAMVRDLRMASRVQVSSFHLPTIDRVRELGLATGYLVATVSDGDIDRAVRHGHGAYHPWHGWLRTSVIDEAHRAGVEVNPWTVDDPARMAELIAWGVDGLITNVPDIARRVIDGG